MRRLMTEGAMKRQWQGGGAAGAAATRPPRGGPAHQLPPPWGATTTGQQRWDQAYQLLLQWATTQAGAAPVAVPSIREEEADARSDLCPGLDYPASAAADD